MTKTTIITEASRIKNILNMGGKYSRTGCEGAYVEIKRKGIIISARNEQVTTMVMIAISKRIFKEYNCKKDFDKTLDRGDLGKILDALPAGDMEVTLIIDPEDKTLQLSYAKIERKIDIDHDTGIIEKAQGSQKAMKNIFKKITKLGSLKKEQFEEFMTYMKNASAMGRGENYTAIEKNKDGFIADTELDDNDNLILNIEKILKEQTTKDMRVLLLSDELAQGMMRLNKMTNEVELLGSTDYPIMLAMHGTDPANAEEFKEDVEVWWLLAPRIESED